MTCLYTPLKRTIFVCFLFLLFSGQNLLQAQIGFTETASAVGIDYLCIAPKKMGGGAAFFDYDMDGWEDLYIIGGRNRDMLYHNNGDGTFTEVGASVGLSMTDTIPTFGVVTGDINNDGFREVVVTTDTDYPNLLFFNNGGTFTEIGVAAGLGDTPMAYAPAFGDYNLDGYLDIYIGNYIEVGMGLFDSLGTPIGYAHDCWENHLYMNNGDTSFTELAMALGVADTGCALAISFTDYDNDADVDILVANDFGAWVTPNALFQNQYPSASPVYTDASIPSGMDAQLYSMGIAIGDYDHDLDLDYYISNIGRNLLARNNGDGTFTDYTDTANVENTYANADSTAETVGWGTAFIDIDNNTWQDLFLVNGWMGVPIIPTQAKDGDKMFYNETDGTFSDISAALGISDSSISRGYTQGDFDRDGDVDMVVIATHFDTTSLDKVRFWTNDYSGSNHYLEVKLQGTVNNYDAYGSHIRIVVGGDQWIHEVSGGSSHCSQLSSIAHFGLGTSTTVDSIIVTWPGGFEQWETNIPADTMITIIEDTSIITNRTYMEMRTGFSAFPNPSNDIVRFKFRLDQATKGKLFIINTIGQEIRLLKEGDFHAGEHNYYWDGSANEFGNLPAGVYIGILETENGRFSSRIVRY